jgi:hypothetical protein
MEKAHQCYFFNGRLRRSSMRASVSAYEAKSNGHCQSAIAHAGLNAPTLCVARQSLAQRLGRAHN